MKVCIVGASGKLGHYMIDHCLDRRSRSSACVGKRACRSSMPIGSGSR
jgi:putative NADH-flavin reductase